MNLLRDQSAVFRAHSPLCRALQLGLLATVPVRVFVALVIFVLFMPGFASAAAITPKPDIGRGGQCVEDPQWMRRNHMRLLRHQRDEVVRKGIRDEKLSLKNCIECHASAKDDSVIARDDSFCVACHRYEAVAIDCFECHSGVRKSAWLQRKGK